MRKIPKKNYLILTVVIVLTVGLVFYARSWYNTSKEYYLSNSVIKDIVSEINEVDINSYTIENPNYILYASSGISNDLKDFEKELKKIITSLDIQSNFIYLNLDNVNIQQFNDTLKKYTSNEKIALELSRDSKSTIYIFSSGKIKYILNNANEKSVSYIKKFLESCGYKND